MKKEDNCLVFFIRFRDRDRESRDLVRCTYYQTKSVSAIALCYAQLVLCYAQRNKK